MPETKHPYAHGERHRLTGRILDATDELMHRLSGGHSTEFLEIGVTMPQAKVLYLTSVDGGLRMSILANRLGVTLSTVSGLVDRLVEAGLVQRRVDPLDRRQVVVSTTTEGDALIQRFRELNRRQLVELLDGLEDDELAVVAQAFDLLLRQAADPRLAEPDPEPSERNHP